MKGVLIAEVAELSGLKTRDSEMIKRWITKTHEHWVMKYQEFTVQYPRRLLLVGTTNERDFLSDPTGNRRFLPFDVGVIDTAAIKRDCEQLWAEGRELYLQHGFDYLTPENMAKNEHEKYSFVDEWIDTVKDYLSKPDPMTGIPRNFEGHHLRGIEVLRDAIGIELKFQQRRDLLRIGRILRELDYSRKNIRIGDVVISAYLKNVKS
jgi:predicted P-loop ATPase